MATSQAPAQKNLEAIKVSGGPHDIGYAYGTACKQLIGEAIDANCSYYRTYCNLTKATVLRLARKYMPFIANYAPGREEEISGISEGAERSQDEILLLVSYYEIMYGYGGGGMLGGCTAVAATGTATVNGETFVAQNNDEALEPWGENFSRVVYASPSSGPTFVAYVYPGFPGQYGINSEGIALCCNTLISGEHRPGVPFQVITREILQQRSIGDAVNAVTRAKRASSANFLIADENGEIYDIETTPQNYDCLYSSERMVHTNHFLSTTLGVKTDIVLNKSIDTLIRYNRMTRILRDMPRASSLENLIRAFKDHMNYPNSICRHPDERQVPKDRMKTTDCIIFSPTRKSMWLARGNPCRAEFRMLSIR